MLTRNTTTRSHETRDEIVQDLQPPPIHPVPRNGTLPLSYAQQRFLKLLEPEGSASNYSVAFRLTGQLNKTALEQSLFEILRRHETLRTTFSNVKERPFP